MNVEALLLLRVLGVSVRERNEVLPHLVDMENAVGRDGNLPSSRIQHAVNDADVGVGDDRDGCLAGRPPSRALG